MGISAPNFGIFGRKYFDKKKMFRQTKIYGVGQLPPTPLPRHDAACFVSQQTLHQ